MRKVTFRADGNLIKRAQSLAKAQHETLSAIFREWLEQFTSLNGNAQEFEALMLRLEHLKSRTGFSRDEMNQR